MSRSTKKGPYVQPCLMEKVEKVKAGNKRDVIKTWSRRSMVIPDFVGINLCGT